MPDTYAAFIGVLDATKALSNLTFDTALTATQNMVTCPRWPAKVVNPPRPLNITKTSAPVLLVNAYRDPATGYDAAIHIKAQIPGSVLLSRDGTGHGSLFADLSTPAIMIDYLTTGNPPADWTIVPSYFWQLPYNATQAAGEK